MNQNLKTILEFAISFALCFAVIFLFTFFGGWKLFESENPILIEVGAAFIISFFSFIFFKLYAVQDKKIDELKNRVEELEEQIKNKSGK